MEKMKGGTSGKQMKRAGLGRSCAIFLLTFFSLLISSGYSYGQGSVDQLTEEGLGWSYPESDFCPGGSFSFSARYIATEGTAMYPSLKIRVQSSGGITTTVPATVVQELAHRTGSGNDTLICKLQFDLPDTLGIGQYQVTFLKSKHVDSTHIQVGSSQLLTLLSCGTSMVYGNLDSSSYYCPGSQLYDYVELRVSAAETAFFDQIIVYLNNDSTKVVSSSLLPAPVTEYRGTILLQIPYQAETTNAPLTFRLKLRSTGFSKDTVGVERLKVAGISSLALSAINSRLCTGAPVDMIVNASGTGLSKTWQKVHTPNFELIGGSGVIGKYINDIHVSGSKVYVASAAGLTLLNLDGAVLATKTKSNGLPSNTVTSVFAKGDTIAVGTDEGLAISTDGGSSFQIYNIDSSLVSNEIRSVIIADKLYIVGSADGISYSRTDIISWKSITTVTAPNKIPSNLINHIFQDKSGVVYVSSNSGISIFRNWPVLDTTLTTLNGLPRNQVNSVYVDPAGTLYAAVRGAVAVAPWKSYAFTRLSSGLGSANVQQVVVSDGTIYAATQTYASSEGGLAMASLKASTFTKFIVGIGTEITSVEVDTATGKVFVGTPGGVYTSTFVATDIAGATGDTFRINSITPEDARYRYQLVIQNDKGCSALSDIFSLPNIPEDITVMGVDLKTCGGYSGQIDVSGLLPQETYVFKYTSASGYTGGLPGSGEEVRADSLGSIVLQLLPEGIYSNIHVLYKRDSLCPSNVEMVEIKNPESPTAPLLVEASSELNVCYGQPILVKLDESAPLLSDEVHKENFRWFLAGNKIANPSTTTTFSYSFRYPPTTSGTLFVFKRDIKTLCSSDTLAIPYVVQEPLVLSYVIIPPQDDTSKNASIITRGLKAGETYTYTYKYIDIAGDTTAFTGTITASLVGTDTIKNLGSGFYLSLVYENLTGCAYTVIELVSIFPPKEPEPDGPIAVVVSGSQAGFLRAVSSDTSCVLSESFLDIPYGIPVGRVYQTQANQTDKLRVEFCGWVQFDLTGKLDPAAKIRRVEYRAVTLDDLGQKVCEVPVSSAAGDLNFSISQVSYNKYGPYTTFDSITFADLKEPKYVDFTASANAQSTWVSLGPDAIADLQNRLNNGKPFQIGLSLAGSDFNLPVYQFHGLVFGTAQEDHELRIFYDVFDYGDAPEPVYATYEKGSVAGPSHKVNPIVYQENIVSPIFIGTPPDAERDGQPHPQSFGDDIANEADEDLSERSLSSYLIPGATVKLNVPVTNYLEAKGVVKLFIDWDKDGEFSLMDELYQEEVKAATATDPYKDTIQYEIKVPYGYEPDTIQCRIRISTALNIDAYGDAPNGEVEDFFLILKGVDYGDLPVSSVLPGSNYPTLWEAGTKTALGLVGARHVVEPRLYLGGSVDMEEFPSPDSDAGSTNGGDDDAPGQITYGVSGDDENGILLLSPMIPGEMAFIKVLFTSQMLGSEGYFNKDAYLDAFIDWNGNGSFEVPDEKLTFTHQQRAGASFSTNFVERLGSPTQTALLSPTSPNGADSVILGFQVPEAAVFDSGVAFMRFRLSWEHYEMDFPTRFPNGLGADNRPFYERFLYYADPELPYPQGEVEDYAIPLRSISGESWYDHDAFGDIDEGEGVLDSLHLVLVWGGINPVTGLPDTVGYRHPNGSQGVIQDILYNYSQAPEEVGTYTPLGGIKYFSTDTIASNRKRFEFNGLIPGEYFLIPKKYLESNAALSTATYPKHRVLSIRGNGVPDARDNDDIVTDGRLDSEQKPAGGVLIRITDKNPKFPEFSSLTAGSEKVLSTTLRQNTPVDPFSTIGIGWIDEPNVEASLDIVGVDYPTSLTCGNFNVIMHLSLKNPTETPLDSLVASLNLKEAYGDAFVGNTEIRIVDSAFTTTSGDQKIRKSFIGAVAQLTPLLNPLYNGDTNTALLTGRDVSTDFYLPGDSVVCVRIEFEINPKALKKFSSNTPAGWYTTGTVSARAIGFHALDTIKQPILDFRLSTARDEINPRFGMPFEVTDSTDEFDDPMVMESLEYPLAGDGILFEGSVADRGLDDLYITFPSPPSLTGIDKYLDENDPVIQADFCWDKAKVLAGGIPISVQLNSDCQAEIDPVFFAANGAEGCSFGRYPEGSYYRLIIQDEETGQTIWASADRTPFDGGAYLGKSLVYKLRSVIDYCTVVASGTLNLPGIDTLKLICPPTIDTLPGTRLPLAFTDIDSLQNNARTWLDSNYIYYTGIAVPENPCIPTYLESVQDDLIVLPKCIAEGESKRQAYIKRTFMYRDDYGNVSSCTQLINFYQPTIILPNCAVELESRWAFTDTLLTPEQLIRVYQQPDAIPYYLNGSGKRIYLTAAALPHVALSYKDVRLNTTIGCGRTIQRAWVFSTECNANSGQLPTFISLENDTVCQANAGWQGQSYYWKQEIFIRDTVKPEIYVPDLDRDGFKGQGFNATTGLHPKTGSPYYDPQDLYNFAVNASNCTANFRFSRDMIEVVEQTNWCYELKVFVHKPMLDLDERPIAGKFEFYEDPSIIVSGSCTSNYSISGLRIPKDTSTNYFIGIRVYDSCDNASTIYIPIRATDNTAPVVKCKDNVRVVLDNTGNGSISAANINAGAVDACGKLAWVRIRMPVSTCDYKWLNAKNFVDVNKNGRIDADVDYIDENRNNRADTLEFFRRAAGNDQLVSPLLEVLPLSCCDSVVVPVELWVSDNSGNRNYCWTAVSVEDKSAFDFVLPASRQLTCIDSIASVDLLRTGGKFKVGTPEYAAVVNLLKSDIQILRGENCSAIQKEIIVKSALSCGVGKLNVAWQLTNPFGGQNAYVLTPEVTVTILPNHSYNIVFPGDVQGDCTLVTDTANIIDGGELGCSSLSVEVQDKVYYSAFSEKEPYCYKIYRTYTAVDDCAYNDACGKPADWAVIVPRDPDLNGADGVQVLVRDAYTGGENPDLPGTGNYLSVGSDGWEEIYFEDACGKGKNLVGETCERVLAKGLHLDKGRAIQYQNAIGPCQYAHDLDTGKEHFVWMFTQQIQVLDSIQPTVLFTTDSVFAISSEDCISAVKVRFKGADGCGIGAEDSASSKVLFIENLRLQSPGGVPVALSQLPNAFQARINKIDSLQTNTWEFSARLEEGAYTLWVSMRDNCGNISAAQKFEFQVRDTVGTSPICYNGVSVALTQNPITTRTETLLRATDFIASAVSDCNGQGTVSSSGKKILEKYFLVKDVNADGLINHLDSLTEKGIPILPRDVLTCTCEDLQGDSLRQVKIRIYTLDERDNWSWCESFVLLSDPESLCERFEGFASISGAVTTEYGVSVPGVEITASGKEMRTYITGQDGTYSFTKIVPNQDITVSPIRDNNHRDGISTFDLVLMNKHIIGNQLLTTPAQLIAADVNNSKSISILDLIQLRKLILGNINAFENNMSWRFIDSKYVFQDSTDWLKAPYPEILNFNNIQGKQEGNILGVKIGDLNGSALKNNKIRSSASFAVHIENQSLDADESYLVEVRGEDLPILSGYQFALHIDPSVVDFEIIPGMAPIDYFGVFKEIGLLTTSWNGEVPIQGHKVLFYLKLKARKHGELMDVIKLDSRFLAPEAYLKDGEHIQVALDWSRVDQSKDGYILKQNIPNPFGEAGTRIGFVLPEAADTQLLIYDISGKLIKSFKGFFDKGYHEVQWDGVPDMGLDQGATNAGVYFYAIKTNKYFSAKKMIRLK